MIIVFNINFYADHLLLHVHGRCGAHDINPAHWQPQWLQQARELGKLLNLDQYSHSLGCI